MNWYLEVLKKYATFGGRAHRTEFWFYCLFTSIAGIVLTIIDSVIGTPKIGPYGVLAGLYLLATLIPNLAVSVRRLHDTNRTGWWLLIGLAPIIGGIVLLVFWVMDSQPEANEYGPNPKVTG